MRLKNVKELARLAARAHPRFSTCGLCGFPWYFVEHHNTLITKTMSCFPLCVNCWPELTVDQRIPFYRRLWESWRDGPGGVDISWEFIEAAVRDEAESSA